MRPFLPMLLAMTLSAALFAQKPEECSSCEHRCLCVKNFSHYTTSQRDILKKTWTDFEQYDLEPDFPLLRSDRSQVENVFSIKLDALGCIYPDFLLDEDLEHAFLNDGQPLNYIAKYCFFMLVVNEHEELGRKYPQHKMLFDSLYAMSVKRTNQAGTYMRLFNFKKKWNEYFLPRVMNALNDLIKKKKITRCVYFVPGFNVPYSLAHLQGNAVFEDVMGNFDAAGKSYDQLLFIRVFWPSHTAKFSEFDSVNCNVDNMTDMLTGVETGRLYSRVTNRVYLASLTMREILSTIPDGPTHHFISHSFGAALTTGIVLHPAAKISDTVTHFNTPLLREYNRFKVPVAKQISFYLSAPGIPGSTSFRYLDRGVNKLHKFYVSYNDDDEILRKDAAKLLGINASVRNATTLGCNWKGEVDAVEKLFDLRELSGQFFRSRTSERVNHDYFCYREQGRFREFFAKYVRENLF
jgi:hypothetical protein